MTLSSLSDVPEGPGTQSRSTPSSLSVLFVTFCPGDIPDLICYSENVIGGERVFLGSEQKVTFILRK